MEKLLQKKCVVCGGVSEIESSFSDVILYRCHCCDHCFSDVKIVDNKGIYGDDYYSNDHKNWFNNPNIALFKRIRDFVINNIKNPFVVDVGCGKGEFLKFLARENLGIDLTGIDFSPNEAVEGIKFIQGDVFSIKLDRRYDVVVTLAVIEHIAESHAYIKLLKTICKPNGLIVIMTLNDRSVLYNLARLLKTVGVSGPYKRLYAKHHINHYNRSSLGKLLDINGLVKVRTINHDIPFKAIDTGIAWYPLDIAAKLCAMIIFWCGRLTGATYLQTVICRNIDRP